MYCVLFLFLVLVHVIDGVEVETTEYAYAGFYKLSEFASFNEGKYTLRFLVRGTHDAHMLLTSEPFTNNEDIFEIVIGGAGNTESVMREVKLGPLLQQVPSHDILSPTESRGFRIESKADGSDLSVFRDGEDTPFMKYPGTKKVFAKYFALASHGGSRLTWNLNNPNEGILNRRYTTKQNFKNYTVKQVCDVSYLEKKEE